jgi:CRISPR/Cas system CMR-associated protein Cmr5 small subunit
MKNLDQTRAANALSAAQKGYKGVNEGQVVKKVPTMVRENGILGALAFAVERTDKGKVKNEGHYGIWQAVVDHFADERVHVLRRKCNPDEFVKWLAGSDDATAARLRAITAEALAYLNYLRRFAKKGD